MSPTETQVETYKLLMTTYAKMGLLQVPRGQFFRETLGLGGGFKYFLFSPLFGEDSHFD